MKSQQRIVAHPDPGFLRHLAVADQHSKNRTRAPPSPRSKFFQFHAVFGEIWQNGMLASPPLGNPGSATVWGGSPLCEIYQRQYTL